MAVDVRPATLIHRSDRGSQYTSVAFGQRPAEADIAASVGSVGDAYDNALAESFFASLESELIDRSSLASRAAANEAVFEYIEAFYNRQRRHSALGQLSPEEFERRYVPTSCLLPDTKSSTKASQVQGDILLVATRKLTRPSETVLTERDRPAETH